MDEHVNQAPELWRKHRPEAPTRPLTHAFVWIDGKRAGRVDEDEVLELDEDYLRDVYPYLNKGKHEVMVDFRSNVGRGACGQVRIQIDNGFEAEPEQEAQAPGEGSELVALCIRLMGQNEKLQKNLLESTNTHSQSQMDSHERLIQFMTMSMERDRERHNAWMEKEANMRAHISDRDDARMANHSGEQKELLSMLISMANNKPAPGQTNPLMDYVQTRIMDGMAGQFDSMMDKATAPSGGMEGLLSAVGPILAQKLGTNGTPPAEPSGEGS